MSRSQHNRARPVFERVYNERAARKQERDRERVDSADTVCTCGAITALDVCPYCGGVRA